MEHIFDASIGTGRLSLLIAALLIACAFEFVNGFHDTANAVATVIYTNSLKPWMAVAWSGLWNFLGVALGGIAVAMSILKLLPAELLVANGTGAGLAMVLALLFAAILWNLGTWYFGLPASSSHTLIGAILGVGIAHSILVGRFGQGVNWKKVEEIGLSLVLSPLFGLTAAALLVLLARRFLPTPALHEPPRDGKPPPWPVRGLLLLTCTGVSYAHGSNDGQKGIGLIMLILIGILPGTYALDGRVAAAGLEQTAIVAQQIEVTVREKGVEHAHVASQAGAPTALGADAGELIEHLGAVRAALAGKHGIDDIPKEARWDVRRHIVLIDNKLAALEKSGGLQLSAAEWVTVKSQVRRLRGIVDYAPTWVLVIVAASLGIGTMIGWKRIVVTVGEKIGKSHLTYAQGASAELVAMSTIGVASGLGLPVSTTHVLSSGIAGTMMAQKAGVQRSTVRNIALAWLLTLPVSMVLSGVLFLIFSQFVAR
jgi:PiT family inorganic phosphate transporter